MFTLLTVMIALGIVLIAAPKLIDMSLKSIFVNGAEQLSYTNKYSYATSQELDFALAPGADGTQKPMAFANADVKFIFIVSDQNVTLFTNADGGAGGTTINLLAGVPLIWRADGYVANPFVAADVTTSYWDNLTSGTTANIVSRILAA